MDDTSKQKAAVKRYLNDNYTDDEREFMLAMRKFQDATGRRYPLFSEVLAVLVSLGYRKVTQK